MKFLPPSPAKPSAAQAFTLIELLVVMTIIAVLAGVLFPAIGSAMVQAKKSSARNDLANIVVGCKAYNTEYGHYPIPSAESSSSQTDKTYGNATGNEAIFKILCVTDANNSPDNPRLIKYLDIPTAKSQTTPVSGFNSKKQWVDPWGTQYVIFLDGDYDGNFTVSSVYTDQGKNNTPSGTIVGGVGAASYGVDKKPGSKGDGKFNGSDDIVSW